MKKFNRHLLVNKFYILRYKALNSLFAIQDIIGVIILYTHIHMIANLITGGFVSILVGVSLIGPIAQQVNIAAATGGSLYNASGWGATVLNLVPGFFSLGILGIGLAVTYASLRQAGVL